MTPSAHKNSIMAKSTTTNPNSTTNTNHFPDHPKTIAPTNAPTPNDSIDLSEKLQPNIENNANTPPNDDERMTFSDDQPEDNSITSVHDNLTKPNPYNTDMRDRMITHATEIKFVKDRYTTPMIVEFSSPLKSGSNTINIASIHRKIFTAMKILDSSLKIIISRREMNTKNTFQRQQKNLTDTNLNKSSQDIRSNQH